MFLEQYKYAVKENNEVVSVKEISDKEKVRLLLRN